VTRSERDAKLLTVLRNTFGSDTFTAPALVSKIAGLAARENPELVAVLGRTNAKRVGLWLKKLHGTRHGDLMLVADRSYQKQRWRYVVEDRSEMPVMPPMPRPPRLTSLKDLPKLEKQQEKLRERFAKDEQREQAAAVREQLKAEEKAAAKERAARDAEGNPSILHCTCTFSDGLSATIQKTVDNPQRGVTCQRRRTSPESPTWQVRILLRGTWAERKGNYEKLVALWHQRAWCGAYEKPFDGDISAELLRGKEIPPNASHDPAHYGTADWHVRAAIRLTEAGISSLELPLDEYALQSRAWSEWGCAVGGNIHRLPGMHCDPAGAIRMRGFDPLQRPGFPKRGG
jgi:hypothetical protein